MCRLFAIASQEQSAAINQITEGLGQIESVINQSTASSEETASASVDLADQANRLEQAVAEFRV